MVAGMVLPRAADFVRTNKVGKAEDTQGRLLNYDPVLNANAWNVRYV
jgi:hypothetical protein